MLSEKSSLPVNLVMPPVVNVYAEVRTIAIKHLVKLPDEHEFFAICFSKRRTCHSGIRIDKVTVMTFRRSDRALSTYPLTLRQVYLV